MPNRLAVLRRPKYWHHGREPNTYSLHDWSMSNLEVQIVKAGLCRGDHDYPMFQTWETYVLDVWLLLCFREQRIV